MWPRLLAAGLVLIYAELARVFAGAPPRIELVLVRWLFVQAVMEVSLWAGGICAVQDKWMFPWPYVALAVVFLVMVPIYALTVHTIAAWVVCGAFYALLCGAWRSDRQHWMIRMLGWALLAGAGGALPAMIGQVESGFAEEEFFVALQAVALGLFSGVMILARSWLDRQLGHSRVYEQRSSGLAVKRWIVALACLLSCVLGVTLAMRAYQNSFYSAQAPLYPGINRQKPFLCGQGLVDPAAPSGEETFQHLLEHIAASPRAAAPEYGMLALATGERRWGEAFREAILDDARTGRFTERANSVKFGQHLAARRAYYLPRVLKTFPDLFSKEEKDIVRAWLAAINRRAMTVEWVDWLYGLAFSYWPMGPYENQENGAGLLALLEAHDLSNEDLSTVNQDYLAHNQRSWFQRFRNTDDAYVYQPEWIDNALYQSEYWHLQAALDPGYVENQRLAFEWLLLQALPDGAPLGYNHPGRASVAQTAYLGAVLLDDPRYVWWSARMLDWAEGADLVLLDQPGLNRAVSSAGVSPDVGSCLMFGDAGLPTQQGPLAPDKIVFRDGWSAGSLYMLLNLRFAGWHRYKATNTVTLLYQGGPLVAEQDSDASFGWLPVGRSLFRDKRIPRENLNGLLIPRTGMSAVRYELTGVGGPWAQDPPHYAEVVAFETGDGVDSSHTAIDNWRGWRHERIVFFYHDGPVVVVDDVSGPRVASGAVSWQFPGSVVVENNRVQLRQEGQSREAVLLSAYPEATMELAPVGSGEGARLLFHLGGVDQSRLVTIFLVGRWVDAEASLRTDELDRAFVSIVSKDGDERHLVCRGMGSCSIATEGGL